MFQGSDTFGGDNENIEAVMRYLHEQWI